MHALILAGGAGTRLRPITNTLPKPLVAFLGEPYAVGLLRRLVIAGIDRATFLVGRDAEPFGPLIDAGAAIGVKVEIAIEEEPLDTAGAARQLLEDADEPALVLNGDVLTDLDFGALLAHHTTSVATVTLWLEPVADTSTFGVVVCDAEGRVQRFVEKPTPGAVDCNTVSAGAYVIAPDVLNRFPLGPLSFERAVFPQLLEAGERLVGRVFGAFWQDLGTPARYLEGTRAVLDGRCRWDSPPGMVPWAGPSLVHTTAVIDPEATIGAGVVIGEGCVIGAGTSVEASVLHDRVEVGARSTIEGSLIGPEVRIGPGVVVPAGSVLGHRTVIGVPS